MDDKSTDTAKAFVAARLRDVLSGTKTQDRIAAGSGIPASTLKDYCGGRTFPALDKFLRIAAAAGVSPRDFFPVTPAEAETAAPAAAAPATASEPPRLDETELEGLIQAALALYGRMPIAEAREVTKALFQRARAPKARPEDAPDEAPRPDTPDAPAEAPARGTQR